MAALRYRDKHNKVGYLQKSKGNDDYHQILDFLGASHIRYALTNNPTIFDSLVKQFWSTATLRSLELGPPAILATIDETPYTITEDSVRSQLQLADDGGIDGFNTLQKSIRGMDNLGTKSGSWDQFGSSIAVALICLSDGRRFNWSSYIFKGMVSNIGNAKKFLMHPRFLQTILAIETTAMLSQAGEGAGVVAPTVPQIIPEPIPEPMPETDQPQDHLTAPPRQQTSDPIAPVFEHGQSSDPILLLFHKSKRLMMHLSLPPMWMMNLWEVLSMHFHQGPLKLPLQKVNSLETEDQVHTESYLECGGEKLEDVWFGEQMWIWMPYMRLATCCGDVDSTKSPGGASSNPAACSYDPTSDVPTTDVPTDVPSGVAPTGPSTVSPGSTTVFPTESSIPRCSLN
ncbi:hypothetical protein Tco_0764043 [Tanacetum coccineum]